MRVKPCALRIEGELANRLAIMASDGNVLTFLPWPKNETAVRRHELGLAGPGPPAAGTEDVDHWRRWRWDIGGSIGGWNWGMYCRRRRHCWLLLPPHDTTCWRYKPCTFSRLWSGWLTGS